MPELPLFTQLSYLVAAALFVLSLKWLSAPPTARRGVIAGEIGMALAIIGTLLLPEIENYRWIAITLLVGTIVGIPLAYLMPMTHVPQRTALSHSFGGLAVGLVGTAKYYLWTMEEPARLTHFTTGVICFEVLLGFLTFTGSLMAFGKLQELLPTRPVVYRGQNLVNLSLLAIAVVIAIYLTIYPLSSWLFPALIALALLFGILLILPIGGADMPTVIALLNSYAGLSASAMGFVLENKLLIIAGALDGSSGFILSIIMCRAMNRSFTNVLFGAFGQAVVTQTNSEERTVRSASPEEAADILLSASRVAIIPGYGMAVAQAQHKVRELFDQLTRRGIEVKFGIHPVAGRMPGHMNVLLAEADIPYDRLLEMEEINAELPHTDVALIIGANDVVNPAARNDHSSPIYGMPIIDADKARTVMVIKRSMNPGFAGIENPLYHMDKTLMLFGDAKSFLGEIVKAVAVQKS
ncbi:MAG: NAD synthetase [Pyrinomonas sp.]|uniref:NAD(P)(+) transhydrogenase (Re/Si-specific) subunit beta n=1 Tax=Pyrinomonas sp. TaxID=2080306 RepID=UPI00331E88BF